MLDWFRGTHTLVSVAGNIEERITLVSDLGRSAGGLRRKPGLPIRSRPSPVSWSKAMMFDRFSDEDVDDR